MADAAKVMIQREWEVTRIGTMEEVQFDNGSVRFRTSIRDIGRDQPFLVRWFNDPTPAADFLEKVESGNYDPSGKHKR